MKPNFIELEVDCPQVRAQKLLQWLQKQGRPASSVEMQKCGPNSMRSAAKIKEALAILETRGEIAKAANKVLFDGYEREAWVASFVPGVTAAAKPASISVLVGSVTVTGLVRDIAEIIKRMNA